ncbi:MlaD family protein [Flavobacterium sp.]|uniref:MlaD family protein n=1 Tax=Flavobacterium sp. TaxID=239 RepID=UPI0037531291
MNNQNSSTWKLGIFVIIGIVLFIVTIYFIGINRNLFGSNFSLKSEFKNVSGLKEGSNVRLSGISIGTVNKIYFISDSLVLVKMLIKKDVQKYIKTDAIASIGSDGLVGDKVLIITSGTSSKKVVKNNAVIESYVSIEIEDIMRSVQKSANNAEIITKQLIRFSYKMNNEKGLLSKIMTNKNFANSVESTIVNLEISAKELAEFTPKINNPNGAVSKIFTDNEFANKIENAISNIQNSTKDIGTFTAKINNDDSFLSKLLTDKKFAEKLETTLLNLENSSNELVKLTTKINNENNVLSKIIGNERLGNSIDSTIINLETASKELKELEAAAKNNFLLRGYFKKKKKVEQKKEEQKR